MIRRSVFTGLTIVLLIALVALIVRGKRIETQSTQSSNEMVRKPTPTLIRALAPQDLKVIESKMFLQPNRSNKTQVAAARHEVEVRNDGDSAYGEMQLRFSYLDRNGRLLCHKTYTVPGGIAPGASLRVTDIVFDDLPAKTASCRTSIDYAELQPGAIQEK